MNISLRAGHDIRIDSRSHIERGLEIVPTKHVGVHATQINRRGQTGYRKSLDYDESDENFETIFWGPEEILNLVAAEKSVFTQADIRRYVRRYIAEEDFQEIFEQVMDCKFLVASGRKAFK